jgi:hypothetical protein
MSTILTLISKININLQRMPAKVFREIKNSVPPHTSHPEAGK